MRILIFILGCLSLALAVTSWHNTSIPIVGVVMDADIDGSGGAQLCTDHGRVYKYVNTGMGNWVQTYQAPSDYYQMNTIDLQNGSNGWCGGNLGGFPGNCMFHYQGSSWASWSSVPVVSQIWDMSFYDQYRGWSAGGDIMYWNNSSWITQTLGGYPGAVYYGISNSGMSFVEAVGIYGGSRIALRYNGTIWSHDNSMPAGSGPLYCVWMLSTTDGWAAGWNGVILRFNGSTWTQMISPSTSHWSRMWFLNANDGWLVGDAGHIAHWNGSSWITTVTPTIQNLYSIVFLSAGNGWAFGNNGVVLHYYDDTEVESTSLGKIKANFQ